MLQLEPALVANAILALLMVLAAFGVPLTDAQRVAVLGAAGPLLALGAALWTRAQVTPIAKLPPDPPGGGGPYREPGKTEPASSTASPTKPALRTRYQGDWLDRCETLLLFSLFVGGLIAGCTSLRDSAVVGANAAAAVGDPAEKAIAADYRAEQDLCRESAQASVAEECIKAVRVRYAPVWDAYRTFRASWVAASSAIVAYDVQQRTGQVPDPKPMLEAIVTLGKDASTLSADVSKLRGGRP